jgi:KilA-N domain
MKKGKGTSIEVQGTSVSIISEKDTDYISLTDMLKAKDGEFFISDWLRNRNTVEFVGIRESIYNPDFNYGEFATIMKSGGLNCDTISVEVRAEKTGQMLVKVVESRLNCVGADSTRRPGCEMSLGSP